MTKKILLTVFLLSLSSLLFVGFNYFFKHSSLTFPTKAQAQALALPADTDWFTVGGNYQRTSWVNSDAQNQTEIRGNLNVEWYQPIEPYIPYKVQPIFANNTAFISTSKGLYAFDLTSTSTQTKVKWVYPTEMPLGNSPTVVTVNNRLTAYVGGYDKKIDAIDANTGTDIPGYTPYEAEAGFETNPLIINNIIYAGNRDGYFYALDAVTGALKWKFKTDGPILFSGAFKSNTLYFASNDMYAYALKADTTNPNGEQIWKSAKLPGAGFYSFWPVIYTEKQTGKDYVIFGGGDNYRTSDLTAANVGASSPYAEISTEHGAEAQYLFPTCYNDSSNNPPTCPVGNLISPVATASASDTFWTPGTQLLDASKASTYFETYPQRRTSLILDASNGQEYTYDANGNGKPEYAPFTLTNVTSSGNRYPAIVGGDNILYSTNTYISGSWIPRGDLVGWKFGTNQISRVQSIGVGHAIDEPMSFAGGGKLIYWSLCGDREAGAFDITLPYGQQNRGWNYYIYDLMRRAAPDYDPMYNNGNPVHYNDMNGWQVYSGKNQSKNGVYGKHSTSQSPPTPYKGMLYMIRGNTLLAWKPGIASGTKLALAAIVPVQNVPNVPTVAEIKQRLESEIQKMLAVGPLRPGYHSISLADSRGEGRYTNEKEFGEIFDYFQNPADTIYTLTSAYPYLSATTQQQVKNYLQNNYGPGSTYDFTRIVHVGWGTGAGREAFDIPAEDFAGFGTNCHSPLNPSTTRICAATFYQNFPAFSFYAAWKYAQIVGNGDQTTARNIFNSMSAKLETPPADSVLTLKPYWLNLYIAGYQGYLELQKMAGLPETSSVRDTYNHLLNLRISGFDKNIPLIWQTGGGDVTPDGDYSTTLAVARNFMFMTPELAASMSATIQPQVQSAVDEYQYVAPYWFVSKFDQTTGEGTLDHLYNYPALFQAKAYILKQPYSELAKYIDEPAFARGDLFYIQSLSAALSVAPNAFPADINGDGKVGLTDLQTLFDNWNTPGYRRADIDSDGVVNGIDFSLLMKDWGKQFP
ncbi:MAG: PQQ-binding-like beta-propeller repeat protein [Patescibacteria group bacterium]|nr:PQQ-binding-like beta-propeller repeat protein [Patescibacteria group bacterium]